MSVTTMASWIGNGNSVLFFWYCFSVPWHRFPTPFNHPVNLNPYSRTMQHLAMFSKLLQCLLVVFLFLSRIPTGMMQAGVVVFS